MSESEQSEKQEATHIKENNSILQVVKKTFNQGGGIAKSYAHKIMTFDLGAVASKWIKGEPATAKASFLYALVIGFVSHLFVYTGRYSGRDDMGMIMRGIGPISTGRWFNSIVTSVITYGYVLPLVFGVLVALFLAATAFLVCKMFNVKKKSNAILIGLLLSTFPSIANTNLFLYETASYHFAVFLAALAVYFTIRYKYGFIIGSCLSMLVLATYQSKYNIALTLCLICVIVYLIDEEFSIRKFAGYATRLLSMVVLGAGLYVISVFISFQHFNATFNNYRGFSPTSIRERLFSVSGIFDAIEKTYRAFYHGFFKNRLNLYLIVDALEYAYFAIFAIGVLFLLVFIIQKKIYKNVVRLFLIIFTIALIPLASNFASFVDTRATYGIMIYAFVLTPVLVILLSERCTNIFPVFQSILAVCLILVVCHYIVGNNIFYLRAHYQNQRTYSLTVRVLDRIEPLLPFTTSGNVAVYGGLPNEYIRPGSDFGIAERILAGSSASGGHLFLNYSDIDESSWSTEQFGANISNNHGIHIQMLVDGDEYDTVREAVLNTNMPVWPAEGSVDIINDVIVVNFGIADVVYESDESGEFYRARHWIREGSETHSYEYNWRVRRGDGETSRHVTDANILYIELLDLDDYDYEVRVGVSNLDTGFSYPNVSLKVSGDLMEAN